MVDVFQSLSVIQWGITDANIWAFLLLVVGDFCYELPELTVQILGLFQEIPFENCSSFLKKSQDN